MKISIVTATSNSEETISDAIYSVSEQEYDDIEHIIIDGASYDRTMEIVHEHAPETSIVISEPDAGIYDALNKGIMLASGDIVGFLHSDDMFSSKHSLSKIVDCFDKYDCDAVYGNLRYVAKTQTENVLRTWISGEFERTSLLRGWMPPHPTFYMKRDCYLKFGGYDSSYRISGDYEALLRYLWREKISIRYVPEILINMRVGGASNRNVFNLLQKTKEDWIAMKTHGIPPLRGVFGKNISKIPQLFARQSQ